MKDIKVAHLKNSLTVNSISRITNSPILKITGEKFNTATDVILDGNYAKQWVALSDKEIVVYLNNNNTISSVAVVTEDQIPNIPNLIFFETGSRTRSVTGIQKLIQNFVKLLLQSPDSNKFKTIGGGFIKIAGKNMVSDDRTARSDIINGINRIKNYMIGEQNPRKDLPLSEKLLDVQILNITSGTQPQSSLIVNISLKNKMGDVASTNVSI